MRMNLAPLRTNKASWFVGRKFHPFIHTVELSPYQESGIDLPGWLDEDWTVASKISVTFRLATSNHLEKADDLFPPTSEM